MSQIHNPSKRINSHYSKIISFKILLVIPLHYIHIHTQVPSFASHLVDKNKKKTNNNS